MPDIPLSAGIAAQEEGNCPEGEQWYAVQCRVHKEGQAACVLKDVLGFSVYLPLVHGRSRGIARSLPFFPGYLFVRADLTRVGLSSINTAPNVVRLVSFEKRPRPLDRAVLSAVRAAVEQINRGGGMLPHSFKPGQQVRFSRGPFRGHEAVFLGPMAPSERVSVLLDLLGRANEIRVEPGDLEPAAERALPRRERGTRGRGRAIRSTGAHVD